MFLYLQCETQATGLPSDRFHCRGEVASQAEVDSFRAAMAKRGGLLEIFASPTWLGDALIRDRTSGQFKAVPARTGGPTRPSQASFAPGGAP